jgi:CRISPR-associated protein Cmr2
MDSERALLKFQIGPVQDFIAQARSTRDLWSGSYLLSWLVAAGIRELQRQGAELIFPNPGGQPLLRLPEIPADGQRDLLTPNLPNVFIARISGDPDRTAGTVAAAIREEWLAIARAVWKQRDRFGLGEQEERRFFDQVDRHLSLSWCATPLAGDTSAGYAEAYRTNGWHLDAVRQTREFRSWRSGGGMTEKDSLSGKEEALVGGEDFRMRREKQGGEYASLFAKHADYLGAISVIKRVWHLAYLRDTVTESKPALKTSSRDFRIRSIPAIASRRDGDDDAIESGKGEKYVAAIAFDGDAIGRWVNGDFLPVGADLATHHADFSARLSQFALKRVRPIVEQVAHGADGRVPLGQLIYAGGDDVVALVPADAALEVAGRLRQAFCEAMRDTPSSGGKPDASAGIAIAHIRSPLQDLIREAQRAEKRAKSIVGRPAFSVTLMKRSGEITHWGSRWETRGWELYLAIDEALDSSRLSAKFPHRVCELLTPYLTARAGLSRQKDAIPDTATAVELIRREFRHAAERQGSRVVAEELDAKLEAYLDRIIQTRAAAAKSLPGPLIQELLEAVIGLATTVAFASRNRDRSPMLQPSAV